jgi:hypothetical protein
MSPLLIETPKPQKNPKTLKPQTPRTLSAYGLLTIKHQSRASYGRRSSKSSFLDFVELGFEALSLSIFISQSSMPIMS